jgi:hypothetical protein
MKSFTRYSAWAPLLLAACSASTDDTSATEGHFTSNQAALYTFDFDGTLETEAFSDPESAIQTQLLYTIGQLNGDLRGVGRLDKTKTSNVTSEALPSGRKRVRYHAAMPVGVGSKTSVPKTFSFRLPLDVSDAGQSAFTTKYSRQTDNDPNIRCAAWEGHELSSGNMWYYYRPNQPKCKLEAADIMVAPSSIVASPDNRNNSYPEYDKIWADNVLSVVAIYGRYDEGSQSNTDPVVSAYGLFTEKVKNSIGVNIKDWKVSRLDPATLTLVPLEKMPVFVGNESPLLTWEGTRTDGRKIRIDALLTNGSTLRAQSPGQTGYEVTFNRWYNERSKEADLIVYTGHAGLGSNVRALTRKGTFVPGKYQMVFMDGCDTFAYVDGYMAKEKARINPDDPNGTKYLDMITTLVPTVPGWTPDSFSNLISGLADKTPRSYEQIFRTFADRDHVVVVTGDEDNVFSPAGPTGPAKDAGAADAAPSADASDAGSAPTADASDAGSAPTADASDAGSAPTADGGAASTGLDAGTSSSGNATESPRGNAGEGTSNEEGALTPASSDATKAANTKPGQGMGCSAANGSTQSGLTGFAVVLGALASNRKRRHNRK